jgi:hypothetical protein
LLIVFFGQFQSIDVDYGTVYYLKNWLTPSFTVLYDGADSYIFFPQILRPYILILKSKNKRTTAKTTANIIDTTSNIAVGSFAKDLSRLGTPVSYTIGLLYRSEKIKETLTEETTEALSRIARERAERAARESDYTHRL